MYGRTVLSQNSVFPTRVSADGKPQYKAGGITIDWSLITAASGDQTLADGSVINYGQVLCRVASNGKYAPYDPSGTTGQEVLTNGRAFILDQTVTQYATGTAILSAVNDQIGEAIDGGSVWLARIIQSGVATHSLSAGPTLAELITAFPRLQLVRDE
jgi:hypothetical protein